MRKSLFLGQRCPRMSLRQYILKCVFFGGLVTLARKVLLKPWGHFPWRPRTEPIFKPSPQRPKCARCYPLNESCSSLQPSLASALKRARGNGVYLQEDGSKHQLWLLRPPSWWLPAWWLLADASWLRFSADSAPQGKSHQWEHSPFCTHAFSPPAFDQALVMCWRGPLWVGVSS